MTDTTGTKLNALRDRASMSLADVAKAAGYAGPSSVQVYFRSDFEGKLSSTVAKRLVQAMVGKGVPPITREELFSLSDYSSIAGENPDSFASWAADQEAQSFSPSQSRSASVGTDRRGDPLRGEVEVFDGNLAADIKILPTLLDATSTESFRVNFEDPVEIFQLPPGVEASRRYVLLNPSNSMVPRFWPGTPLLIEQRGALRTADDVFVHLKGGAGEYSDEGRRSEVTGLIGTLFQRTASFVEVDQWNPQVRFRIPFDQIRAIHRIIPWHEAIGL